MGCCFASKAKAETLIIELKNKTEELYKAETKLATYDGNIRDMQKASDMKLLESEHQLSLENLERTSRLFPVKNLNISENISDIHWEYPVSRPYITNKLKIAELQTLVIKRLADLNHQLKKIDNHKNHVNNSAIETIRGILEQKEFDELKPELEEIRKEQIELSSFRGGSLHNLLCRIERRCAISKKLEMIQSKIESAQYSQDLDNIVTNAEEMNEELAELGDKIKATEESSSLLKALLENVPKNEIQPLDEKLEDLEKIINNTLIDIKSRKSYKSVHANKLEEIARLQIRLNYCKTEIDLLQMKKSEISKDFEIFSQIFKVSSRISKKVEARKKTRDELLKQLEKLKGDNEKALEDSLHEKDERTLQMDKNLTDVASISNEIDKNLKESMRRKKEKMKVQIALRLFHSLRESLEHWVWKWKIMKYARSLNSSIIPKSFDFDALDQEYFKAAEDFMNEEKEIMLNNDNPLLKCTDFTGIKPMESLKLFKYLEEIMDRKYEMDIKDISEGLNPTSYPEFVYKFTLLTFGIQKSAERHITRILLSLKQHSEKNHLYSKFFCDLFQVFTSDPTSYEFSIFLTRTRYDFQSIIYKYEKKDFGSKPLKSPRNKQAEYLEKGGHSSLSDVVDLIVCIFENNKSLGITALQMIKPETISSQEFVTFLICQKVARMDQSIENLFLAIDKDSSKTIDLNELASFTRASMDLWVNDSDLETCFQHLVTPGTNSIHHDAFIRTFSTDFFTQANDNERYLVSKESFLKVLTDLHRSEYKKQVASMIAILEYYPENLNKSEFSDLIAKLDPSFAKDSERLFVDIMQVDGKVKNFEFISLVMRKGIGNWKNNPFAVFNLIQGLRERNGFSFRKSFVCYSSNDISRISLDTSDLV
jgi:hypothetical protein